MGPNATPFARIDGSPASRITGGLRLAQVYAVSFQGRTLPSRLSRPKSPCRQHGVPLTVALEYDGEQEIRRRPFCALPPSKPGVRLMLIDAESHRDYLYALLDAVHLSVGFLGDPGVDW